MERRLAALMGSRCTAKEKLEEQQRVVQLEILAGVAKDSGKDEPRQLESQAMKTSATPLPIKLDATVNSLNDQIRKLGH